MGKDFLSLIPISRKKTGPKILKYARDHFKDNQEFIFEAMDIKKYDPWNILDDYASDELKRDKEFMLKAVGKDGLALKVASKDLQEDEEVISIAVQQNIWASSACSR